MSGKAGNGAKALPRDTVVAVVGAGTMGSGIAQVAAVAGHPVLLFDSFAGAAERGRQTIAANLARLVAKGSLDEAGRGAILDRIRTGDKLEALAGAGLVVEAIIEDLTAKRALFTALEGVVSADCILATNTSSISIESIGAPLSRPERLAGLHFFNPAPLMALVEVVRGRATDPAIADRLLATAAGWGKVPVLARSTPGFIVNRVARPFYAEALRVLAEGAATPAALDAVMRGCGGFRMGPCELMDLIGHDVNYAVTRSVWDAFHNDPRFQPSLVQRELVEAGWLGRKSGRGFYDHRPGAAAADPGFAPAASVALPASVTVAGALGFAAPLLDRIRAAGIAVEESAGPGLLRLGPVTLAPTDGRLATERAAESGGDLVLFDWALDWAKAGTIAIAPARQTSAAATAAAVRLFQALGMSVALIDDVPGLIAARTVAMLVNEAADALNQGVADGRAIDLAMTRGVNYPVGPLAWGDRVGPALVLRTLDNLARTYGEDRYRASPLLRRCALAGVALLNEKDS
ncbi:3-hydroxyacyl-CoA dehydrogenase PaaH [Azospirillum agricola]|uniref:3-hydroxyacyl-CoA dehydrogenase PaaH n=1 Tax=Azospirillum agricola TaxID=1720247 RepID=UPI000A0EF81F|nr:3-hydroxyacyl-CoA dehydrogenase PaaH [Azospirillum agricola]SMH31404.1 3-hydroxyacyl-CoA dehydrogenase [Azospirillum lipoferum]